MAISKESRFLALIATQELDTERSADINNLLCKGLDWAGLFKQALYHGLASMLYRHCRDLGLFTHMPEWIEETLKNIYHKTILLNLRILQFLNDFGIILRQENSRVIVLQGAALLLSVYDDIGIRPMEDIDLMVLPDHGRKIKQLLEGMGFSPDPIYPDSYKKGMIYIDIHLDPFSGERINARKQVICHDSNYFRDSALLFMEKEIPIYRLSHFDNLIALSHHLLKHNFTRLKWFVDIRETLFSKSIRIDWDAFASYCRRTESDRCILYILILLRRLLNARVPAKALEAFGASSLSCMERLLLRLRLADSNMGPVFQILWLFLIKGKKDKFRFILETAFPRKKIMAQIFPSSPGAARTHILRFAHILFQGLRGLFTALGSIVSNRGLPRL